MGADISIPMFKGLDIEKLESDCANVPIDVYFVGDMIHFHYAYWSIEHTEKCQKFVENFCKQHKINKPEWSY
jgi:hypothetical protein